jgi:hypothetical protein
MGEALLTWAIITSVLVLGASLIWLAIDGLRKRYVFWNTSDEIDLEYGYARKRDEPLRFWAWVFIWGASGAMCVGFSLLLIFQKGLG